MRLQHTSILFSLLLVNASTAAPEAQFFGEWLGSDEIKVTQATTLARFDGQNYRIEANYTWNQLSLDYSPNAPIDPFGFARSLDEMGHTFSLLGRWEKGPVRLLSSLGGFDGFRDPNSVWLAEYYRQQWDGVTIPGQTWRESSPSGLNAGLGIRYEYLPASGYAQLDVAFADEKIAPGYEAELDLSQGVFALVRGVERLQTWSSTLTLENVLTSYMRSQQQLSIVKTTARSHRYSWSGNLIYAMNDAFTLRAQGAYTKEGGEFHAWSAGLTGIYSLTESWQISLSARYYSDSGQIENANLVSSAAPELISKQFVLGIHWHNADESNTFSLSAGPYSTNYAATGIGTERFANLYLDRNWLYLQSSYSIKF